VGEQDAPQEATSAPPRSGSDAAVGTDHELEDLERELCRLPDVSAARIVADGVGRPTEVHILALPGKHAKQVVRDVQSVALASFGLELDRRIVSVVQLGANGNGDPKPVAAPVFRPVILTINAETTDLRALIRVTLALGEEQATGFAEGSVASSARHRLVAGATLDALRQLAPSAEAVDVDSAQIVRVGPHDVAVVTVVFVAPPLEQVVSGSAIVRLNAEADAVARAMLDATNRRLPRN
jgi:hypothetical protein